jgi:hypothetical protein
MSNSKVFFTGLRTKPNLSLTDKLIKLIKAAGIENIDFNKKFTAIKIHFGEPGNLAYLRPNYSGRVVSFLKEKGAIPFLTDTNTLYHGRRSNAPEHLDAAYENGYNPLSTGCHVIIADGIRGTEYTEIETGQLLSPVAKIGSAIASSEVLISMNHFKGHEMMGFGGALKNLGMGCASVGGKLELHSKSAPEIFTDNCTGCRVCERNCAHDAIKVNSAKIAVIDTIKCVGCGQCIAVCQYDSARVVWDSASEIASKMVAEYAIAAVKGKPHFHINFMTDISPDCDCFGNNDAPLVADIGIAASFDPVALDMACADMVKKSPALPGTRLTDNGDIDYTGHDKFTYIHPNTNWLTGLQHAEFCGLGSLKYDLLEV